MHSRPLRITREAPAATGASSAVDPSTVASTSTAAASSTGGHAPPVRPVRSGAAAGRVTTVFFGRQAVRVTDHELLVDNHLYAMSGIDGVRVDARRARSIGLVVLAVLAPVPMAGAGLAVSGWSPLA